MRVLTKYFMFLTRVTGYLLIGVNIFRFFDQFKYLDFMQSPGPALFNSFLILAVSYLPRILKLMNFEISDKLFFMILTTVAISLTGGLIFKLYRYVPGLDSIMHFLNGGLLILVGLSILNMFVGNKTYRTLSPLFIILFAFSFAMMLGTMWEVFEYFSDGFFGSNMQRYKDANIEYVGRVALKDTMKDLILNTIGALIISFIFYLDIRREAPYLNALIIREIEEWLIKNWKNN